MYDAGESAMGGCSFQLVLNDGRALNCDTRRGTTPRCSMSLDRIVEACHDHFDAF